MAMGAAGDGLLRGVFEGCISAGDMGIQHRPYHKHCGCALHKSRRHCPHPPRHTTVSYPIRRSWSEGNLALIGQSSPPCSSSSPAAPEGIRRTSTQLVLYKEEDEELQGSSPKA